MASVLLDNLLGFRRVRLLVTETTDRKSLAPSLGLLGLTGLGAESPAESLLVSNLKLVMILGKKVSPSELVTTLRAGEKNVTGANRKEKS